MTAEQRFARPVTPGLWTVQTNNLGGSRQPDGKQLPYRRSVDLPAPTVTGLAADWLWLPPEPVTP